MTRREDLLDRATDHVVAEGLIGLTLRPVAAAIGTSDRMLMYHFGSRDGLVSAVLTRTEERSIDALEALPAVDGVAAGVRALWEAYQQPPLSGCLSVYLQAAATGLIGSEPYRSIAREVNQRWDDALSRYVVRCGAPAERAARVTTLVDSALLGFYLDLPTEVSEELTQGVHDLAEAAETLATVQR
ncbi:TetR family transcriptional regulator [Nocardioides sp.]|uniref:TetR/AcrR family transcriptional regulator n=1 Tax=Nocardioides sp. TaxID=35761 RepID=UPI002634B51F|nr:TetR family transcriptional regulator [Nocardioides sp.]